MYWHSVTLHLKPKPSELSSNKIFQLHTASNKHPECSFHMKPLPKILSPPKRTATKRLKHSRSVPSHGDSIQPSSLSSTAYTKPKPPKIHALQTLCLGLGGRTPRGGPLEAPAGYFVQPLPQGFRGKVNVCKLKQSGFIISAQDRPYYQDLGFRSQG